MQKDKTRQNKYLYLYIVQGHYGYGWEDLTSSESYKEALNDYNDYNRNEMRAHRIIKRRITNNAAK